MNLMNGMRSNACMDEQHNMMLEMMMIWEHAKNLA